VLQNIKRNIVAFRTNSDLAVDKEKFLQTFEINWKKNFFAH
jgi:hypothetical protein